MKIHPHARQGYGHVKTALTHIHAAGAASLLNHPEVVRECLMAASHSLDAASALLWRAATTMPVGVPRG